MKPDIPFIHDLARALRRHWRKSLLFYMAFLALVIAFLLVVPRKYESVGIFYVRYGRGGMTLDPTATTSKTVNIQETRESEINSIGDVLSSRGLVEQVVDRVGAERILETGKSPLSDVMSNMPGLPSFGEADEHESVDDGMDYATLKYREKAVRKLLEDIRVKPTRKAATISVACRAATPVLARDVVTAMMDTYLDVHIEANRTDGAHDFFVEQLANQRARVTELASELRDFKNRINVTSIQAESSSVQEQINVLEKRIIEVNAELAAATKRLEILEQQYAGLDDRLVTEVVDGHSHEGTDLMRDRLFQLEMNVAKLLVENTPSHPKVVMAKQELQEAKQVYNAQPDDRQQVKNQVNPTKMTLHGTLLNALATQRGIQSQLDALTVRRQTMYDRLELLNNNEVELLALERDLDVAKSSYATYADKLEEARINRELDLERISNVKVVQEPTLVLKPASPKRALILLIAVVTGFAGAVMLAQLLHTTDDGLHTAEEVADALAIPVLAELPRIPSRRVMAHGAS